VELHRVTVRRPVLGSQPAVCGGLAPQDGGSGEPGESAGAMWWVGAPGWWVGWVWGVSGRYVVGWRPKCGRGVTRPASPAGRLREQQVDEALDRGLGFVVGQARPLVGLDDHVLLALDVGDHEVQPDHGDVERPAGPDARLDQRRVQ